MGVAVYRKRVVCGCGRMRRGWRERREWEDGEVESRGVGERVGWRGERDAE